MSTLHVIYIPGLGDQRLHGQRLAVQLWRLYGVKSQIYQMLWHDSHSLDTKLHNLLEIIDGFTAKGEKVGLVAASAGASAALNTFAQRKNVMVGVVLLCGKVQNPQNMHPSVTQKNVAFGQALARLPDVLNTLSDADRARIMSVHPLADESVPIGDTRIPGSLERTIPVVSHVFGIAYGLTIYAPFIMRFLKRQARA